MPQREDEWEFIEAARTHTLRRIDNGVWQEWELAIPAACVAAPAQEVRTQAEMVCQAQGDLRAPRDGHGVSPARTRGAARTGAGLCSMPAYGAPLGHR